VWQEAAQKAEEYREAYQEEAVWEAGSAAADWV